MCTWTSILAHSQAKNNVSKSKQNVSRLLTSPLVGSQGMHSPVALSHTPYVLVWFLHFSAQYPGV